MEEKKKEVMARIIKRVLQAVSILLAVALVVLLIVEHQENKKKEAQLEEEYLVFRPFQEQKQELEEQLKQVEREYQVKINGKGTLSLLCVDMKEDIFTVIYPQLKKYGYIAMLAVSEDTLPGTEGCMKTTQVKDLLDEGWSLCLYRKEETDPEKWLTEMRQRLDDIGLEMPEQIYFERGSYQTAYDELLAEHGLEVVIHHQEPGLPALMTQTEEGIWHIGAWGWNQENARENMETAVEKGAGLVFTIGAKYYYEEEQFTKMLGVLAGYEEAESLYVTDVTSAYSYRGEAESTRDAYQKELEAEREKLKAEIAAVEKKLQEAYKKKEQK